MKKVFLLLFLSTFFIACSSDDDSFSSEEDNLKELKLSVNSSVQMDGLDFTFDILDGNGGYVVSVLNEDDAIVTIEDTKVKVSMLNSNADITITDEKGQKATVSIGSTAKELIGKSYYGLFMNVNSTLTMTDVNFGVGEGYSLHKIKGASVNAEMFENGHIKFTSVKPGNSYYKIKDKRGKVAHLEVLVVEYYELTANNIEITAVNDQRVSVLLKSGKGGWKIQGGQSSLFIENAIIISDGKYDILQIDTTKDNNVKGITNISLQDKEGNEAIVSLRLL